jgi:hypothetical protein
MAITRVKADTLIRKNGATAKLRRNGVDRACSAMENIDNSHEQGLRSEGAKQFLVSCLDPLSRLPIVPPDPNEDVLVFAGDIYRIVAPDIGPRPNGNVVYHSLQVVYDQKDE